MCITIETAWRMGAERLSASTDSAILEAQILLSLAIKQPRAYLYTYPDSEVSRIDRDYYQHLLARRQAGEPIAYLVGHKEFYSLDFNVNAHVLIPRPETEVLVDEALKVVRSCQHRPIIADLGTGTGAIAITLAMHVRHAHIIALDCSENALQVAKLNARKHDCEHIQFICSDWFTHLPLYPFDCIVSNPPYLTQDEWLSNQALRQEPVGALIGGEDGLCAFRAIIHHARNYLKTGGSLLLEHGDQQGKAIRDILQQAGYLDVYSVKDLSGKDRVSHAQYVR